jgi:hypothetical protein
MGINVKISEECFQKLTTDRDNLLAALQSLCDAERQVEQHGQKDAGGYLETELVRSEDLLEAIDKAEPK